MHPSAFFASAFLAFSSVSCVVASLYVTSPLQGGLCHGGQPCTVNWLDDGEQPLLNSIGECTVGLYAGKENLVQTIQPVNVGTTHSLQFTPDPEAGPKLNTYFIAFTSTTAKSTNGSAFVAFSASFSLDGMTGSLASPVPSDTASIPIPHATSETISTTTGGPARSSTTSYPSSHSGFTTLTSSTHTSASSSNTTRKSSTSSTSSPSPSTNMASAYRLSGPSAFSLVLVSCMAFGVTAGFL